MIATYLTLHRVRVDLAHIGAAVLSLDASHVERPRVVVVVGDREAGVVRDDVLVDGQDRLRVCLDPGHLRTVQVSGDLDGLGVNLIVGVFTHTRLS